MTETKDYHETGRAAPIKGRAAKILALCELGHLDQARALIDNSLDPNMLLMRGMVHHGLARAGIMFSHESAKDIVTRAMRLGADPDLSAVVLSLAYWRQGQESEASIVLESALTTRNLHTRFLALLARIQIETDKKDWRAMLNTIDAMAQLVDSENDCNKGKYFNHRGIAYGYAFEECGGDYRDRALADYHTALHHYENCGSDKYQGITLNNMASLCRVYDPTRAHGYIDQAMNIFIRLKDRVALGGSKDTKAQIFIYEGNLQSALRWANDSIRLLTSADDVCWLGNSYATRGMIYRQLGEMDNAIRDFELAANAEEAKRIHDALVCVGGRLTPAAKILKYKGHSTLRFVIKEKHPELKFLLRPSWKRRKSIMTKP